MRNAMEIALKMNIGFVTSDLYVKYIRNHIANEHRVCNLRFICKVLLTTNIGFVISDLYAKYFRNLTKHEHTVCNLRFVCEMLRKSH